MSDTAHDPQAPPEVLEDRMVLTEEERARPIWELIRERAHRIPAEDVDRVPHDGSVNHDHYLYGSPRKTNP